MRPLLLYILFIKRTGSGRGNIHLFGAKGRRQRWTEPSLLEQSYFGENVASRPSLGDVRAWGSPPSGFCSRDSRHYFFSVDNSLPRCPSVSFPTAPYSHGKANAKYREERTTRSARGGETERGREKKRRSWDTEEERRGTAPLSRGNGGTLRPHPAGASFVDRTMRTGARWFIEAARLSPLRWFALSAAAAVA